MRTVFLTEKRKSISAGATGTVIRITFHFDAREGL
jgi:hypothetical protein